MDLNYFISEPLTLIALITLIFYLFSFLQFYSGYNSIKNLKDIEPGKLSSNPKVSIIIPARNEEKKIKEAIRSVLNLDYDNYEVMVINDRSEDRTGEILDEMTREFPQLNAVHIDSLPEGWLGKNYVLDYGAQKAEGEYLVFTDADVVFQPDTLLRVIPYVTENKTDHLAMAPSHVMRGFWLTAVVTIFEFMFMMRFKPWKASNPKSKKFIGIGSFNMIRADAYKKTGGFSTIRMRPDDDIMLGKLVKKHGLKSDFIFAPEQLRIEWYSSLGEMIRAFYKNAYSGFNYNIINALFSCFLLFMVGIFPYINLLLADKTGIILNSGILLIIFFIYLVLRRVSKLSILYFFTYPLSCSIILYLILRAVLLTVKNKGIEWRGTYYSLKELKKNKV